MQRPIMPLLSGSLLQSDLQLPMDFSQEESTPVLSVKYINHVLDPQQELIIPFFIKFDSAVFTTSNVETDNSTSSENKANDTRLLEFEQKFSKQFIAHILEDDFEYGIDSKAHAMVKNQMKINSAVTKDWLNRIYVTNFQNPEILIGILRVIARFEKEEIFPIGQTIATASLNHKDEIVQETAIRAFESWGGKSNLKILENVTVSSKWIKEYLDGVISDLKSEYVGEKN
ncbi:MAG: hypothetical protein LBL79_00540 [Prevotella sp.]|jgi:hypothetical protein|nr:hypothetical protein [Prevotella sp.]